MRRLVPAPLAAFGALALLALTPQSALAHSSLVESRPAAGEKLGVVPDAVVLEFSEPLNRALSHAAVTTPTGPRLSGVATGDQEIRISLATNAPGLYQVDWTTVSARDGHSRRGTFDFGVGVAPTELAGGTAPSGADLLVGAARAAEYAALLASIGMLLLGRLARRQPALGWVRPRLGLALATALISGLTVVGAEVLAGPGLSREALSLYLSSPPGLARLLRLLAEAVALALRAAGLPGVPATVLLVLVALAASGHAAAAPAGAIAIPLDTVHLLSAGLWAGAILALATLRPPGGWLSGEGRRLLDRFSPVALAAFAGTVASGALRGSEELTGLPDLVASFYGRALALKGATVVCVAVLSVLAWRRRITSPRLEAALVVGVIGVSALLAAYPLPPSALEQTHTVTGGAQAGLALPSDEDLTMGDHAGQYLVGLTLRPAQPGSNIVWAYVLPLEGEGAAAGVPVDISSGRATIAMQECGQACRRARIELHGGDVLRVHVGGATAGSALFPLSALPADDAVALLAQAQARMHRLHTYRVDETLSSGRQVVRTSYEFQAPDRMHVVVSTGYEMIALGIASYTRDTASSPWSAGSSAPLTVPFFDWDFSPIRAPHLLGSDDLNGRHTQVVSFFEDGGSTPIWFRLWLDSRGQVWEAQMMTQGHFMDQRFSDLDIPVTIGAPVR